ncbi:hypothetical protein E2C01_032528 [Portunus trituberculatus]|uniref:Uncharacterized protein n=1 Tax=Portunus trituberculatus TaxID=210409 RepID=A0A5B7F195_PORTR|nr:hypothetical protein [Portunus trituberculatus]
MYCSPRPPPRSASLVYSEAQNERPPMDGSCSRLNIVMRVEVSRRGNNRESSNISLFVRIVCLRSFFHRYVAIQSAWLAISKPVTSINILRLLLNLNIQSSIA